MNNSSVKLFIDSADLGVIDRWLALGASGITTNPSIVAAQLKEMGMVRESSEKTLEQVFIHLRKIMERAGKITKTIIPVSVQLSKSDPGEMIEQAGFYLNQLDLDKDEHLVVKVPFAGTQNGRVRNYLDVIAELSRLGFRVNATCLMSAEQSTMALMAGARYVSLFYCRINDSEGDACTEIATTARRIRHIGAPAQAEIIVGSIRQREQIGLAWDAGADIVTVPAKVLATMGEHERTVSTTDEMFANARSVGL